MSELEVAEPKNNYNDEKIPDIEIDNKEILEKAKENLIEEVIDIKEETFEIKEEAIEVKIENVKEEEIKVKEEVNEVKEDVKEEVKENVKEEVNEEREEKREEKREEEVKIEDKKDEILIKTFLQLFESFLTEDNSSLEKLDLKLTPEVQKYFLVLCKENPDLFGSFEETLKNIIFDNKINSKDIPDILVLVSKVYKIIKQNKHYPRVDFYELIKTLLHLGFIVYMETNKVKNPELLLELLKIIDTSIELIKLTPIIHKKKNCFNCLFSC